MSSFQQLRNSMVEYRIVDKFNREQNEKVEKECGKVLKVLGQAFELFTKNYYIGDTKVLEFTFNDNHIYINDPEAQQKKEMTISSDEKPDYSLREAVKGKIEENDGYTVELDEDYDESFIISISLEGKTVTKTIELF